MQPTSRWKTGLVLLALSVTCASVNLTKAVHIDDTAYLEIAQAILQDPFHPISAGKINWDNTATPISAVNQPHLFFYAQALVMLLSGHSELALHGLMAIVSSISVLAFYLLARLLAPRHALFLTSIFFLGPVFLPGQNLMTDVPLVTLWLIFYGAILAAGRDHPSTWYAVSSLAAAAACLVKYTSLVLLPVFAAVILLRRQWRALAFLLVPLAALAAWSLFNYADYGGIHLLERRIAHPITTANLAGRVVDWIAGLGAVAPFSIAFLSPSVVKRSGARPLAGILIASTAVLLISWHHPQSTPQTAMLWALFVGNGLFVLALLRPARGEWGNRLRPEQTTILALWLAGTLSFTVLFAPIMAIRHVLLALPPLLFLLAGAFEHLIGRRRRQLALAATAALGIALAISDYQYADVYREQAFSMIRNLPADAHIWYAGHWGWQWYAGKAGMKQFDTYRSELKPGDYLIVPSLVHRQVILPEQRRSLERVREVIVDASPATWLRTMSEHPLGGYYAYSFRRFHGPPWRFSTQPLDTFSIFLVADSQDGRESSVEVPVREETLPPTS